MNKTLLALAAAALCASAPSHALTPGPSTLNGNLLDTSFSSASLLALDLTVFGTQATTLAFTVDADDIAAGGIDFQALIREVAGAGIGALTLSLDGASFGVIGTSRATTLGGELLDAVAFAPSPGQATLGAATVIGDPVTELYLGNVFFEEGASDWRIEFGGLAAGATFTLDISTVAAVPEPREWMLMLAGFGLVGLSAARRLSR